MAECGLLNLASCITDKFFQYLLDILNAPIKPFLTLIKNLLSEPINISLFSGLWASIIYIISMFYGFLFLYSGFNFMVSGYDAVKRENAKSWLRNVVIMIILIQASYFIYELAIELSAIMTTTILSLMNNNLFLIMFDPQLIFILVYIPVLFLTVLILIIRYVVVAIGVVFFPIAIFLYFIPPLRSWGSWILNILGINIFVTFFDALVLIGFSQLLSAPVFMGSNILVMIATFLFIDILTLFLMFFSLIKSGVNFATKVGAVIAKFA